MKIQKADDKKKRNQEIQKRVKKEKETRKETMKTLEFNPQEKEKQV